MILPVLWWRCSCLRMPDTYNRWKWKSGRNLKRELSRFFSLTHVFAWLKRDRKSSSNTDSFITVHLSLPSLNRFSLFISISYSHAEVTVSYHLPVPAGNFQDFFPHLVLNIFFFGMWRLTHRVHVVRLLEEGPIGVGFRSHFQNDGNRDFVRLRSHVPFQDGSHGFVPLVEFLAVQPYRAQTCRRGILWKSDISMARLDETWLWKIPS